MFMNNGISSISRELFSISYPLYYRKSYDLK